ncbi:single-stranded-DNA-specific exonuclease RecJ [Thalassobacillus hwangdonensis]|uniref:Single-stranded-DNA-specific exonuclease RecJ n=2 Tax=Thalassobacillus hwangdonensis TaxID=546108 RepID=A0ABW3L182_9BACI
MNWKFTYSDEIETESFLPDLNLSPMTQRLLWQRNVRDIDAVRRFLSPSLDDLHDPFLMDGMEATIARVRLAIQQEEKILVFGDYDADGVSATTVMVQALREAGADCDFYIPNRFTEGYGPNEQAFRLAHERGFSLIITVDTGIAAVDEAAVAKELGIDLIITDHHEVQEQLPDAYAIVHPKTSAGYPFQELAGVGVAFKFAQALSGEIPHHLLDMVAIGTVADLVTLTDENRVLVHFGLKALSNSERPGVKALRHICGIDGPISEETVGFMIGPRINAVGRLQDASPAVDLMLTQDAEEAAELASEIDQLNKERQKIVADIAKEAEKMMDDDQSGDNDAVIVVGKEGWNPGVLGIVASRLTNKYDRPAIVLGFDAEKGEAKGSARSIDAFDLFVNCMKVRHVFKHFGGHSQAAGMTLPLENVDMLRDELNLLAKQQLSEEDFKQSMDIQGTVDIESLSTKEIEEIDKLSPFGMGNPKPIFHIENEMKEVRQIGSKKNHLKFQFTKNGSMLDGIAFGMGDLYTCIAPSSKLEAIGELNINEWNGRRKPQIMIKDVRVSEWQLFDHRGARDIEKKLPGLDDERDYAVIFEDDGHVPLDLPVLTKESVIDSEVDSLILLDLPDSLEDLASVLQSHKPNKVYACYRVTDGAFLNELPTREHFKWFYAMLMKRGSFDLEKDGDKLAARRGWSPSTIDFISKVFFDLEFVRIENGLISVHPTPSKKDLSESITYQNKQRKLQVEKTLYYSSYRELKTWFDKYMEETEPSVKEEVTSGF